MGEKRVSTRTLPDGTKCLHHPPDDVHPEGKLVLIHHSTLRDKLNDALQANKAAHAEIQAVHEAAIATKKATQAANGMPPEKAGL